MGILCLRKLMEEYIQGTEIMACLVDDCPIRHNVLCFLRCRNELVPAIHQGCCVGASQLCHYYTSVTTSGISEAISKVQAETKVGKFLIPIVQYSSNGSEFAGKRGWFRCLSGPGSHSDVGCGCLTTAHSVCPGRCSDGCAISRDILLLSCL